MSEKKTQNFLEMVPVPSPGIGTVLENDKVILTTPRFSKAWMARLFLFGKKNEIRVKLDENGSRVWQLIDGQKKIQEIIDCLSTTAEKEENYNERALLFLKQLAEYGAIKLKTN